jgi:hypothetical protein
MYWLIALAPAAENAPPNSVKNVSSTPGQPSAARIMPPNVVISSNKTTTGFVSEKYFINIDKVVDFELEIVCLLMEIIQMTQINLRQSTMQIG